MLSPVLSVTNIDATIEFYTQKLGFTLGMKLTDTKGHTVHASVLMADTAIMFSPMPDDRPGACGIGVDFFINVPAQQDIDAYYADLQAQGVSVVHPIKDEFWGDRTFGITDLDGYRLSFTKTMHELSTEDMQAAMVNQP